MPQVERTGIYRNADGASFFLRKDRLVSEDIAENYELDESAKLNDVRQAIADADNKTAPLVAGVDVTSEQTNTAGEVLGSTEPEKPAPVAPRPARRGRPPKSETPEDKAPRIETPEDKAPRIETLPVVPVEAIAGALSAASPAVSVSDGADVDGDGKADADEAADSEV